MAASGRNPRILAIVCSWHPLTAADNAGMDLCSYGTSTTILSVGCAGAVSAAAILRAFSSRADGVLVAACGQGDCHYVNGNESCEKVVDEARELMQLAGVAPGRLRFDLSSDVDGKRFAALLDEFSAEVSKLNGRAPRKRKTPGGAKAKKTTRTKSVPKRAAAKKATAKKVGPKKATAKKVGPKKATAKKKKKPASRGGRKR